MPNDYVSQFKGHNNTLYDIRDDNTIYVGHTSGSIAHCSDAIDNVDFREIITNIMPVQSGSGDPSPSNPRAIIGVSEVITHNNGSSINQWDEQWELGSYNWTTGVKITTNNLIRSKNKIMLIGGQTYYFKVGKPYNIFSFNLDGSFINALYKATDGIYTPTNDLYIAFSVQNSTTYNNDISINYPATDTAYHAYTGQTATVNFGGTYYGGYLNVTTGLLTNPNDVKTFNDVNLTWTYNSTYGRFECTSLQGTIKPAPDNRSIAEGLMCECYLPTVSASSYADDDGIAVNNNGTIHVYDNSYNDVNTWLSAIGSYKFRYTLITPQTVQLTPAQIEQLLGENNVWADSGDINVEYYRNTSVVQAIRDLASIDHLGFWRDDNGCLCQG